MHSCEQCGTKMKDNMPGVSLGESPHWSLTREDEDSDREILGTHETLYFCSDDCVQQYIG